MSTCFLFPKPHQHGQPSSPLPSPSACSPPSLTPFTTHHSLPQASTKALCPLWAAAGIQGSFPGSFLGGQEGKGSVRRILGECLRVGILIRLLAKTFVKRSKRASALALLLPPTDRSLASSRAPAQKNPLVNGAANVRGLPAISIFQGNPSSPGSAGRGDTYLTPSLGTGVASFSPPPPPVWVGCTPSGM